MERLKVIITCIVYLGVFVGKTQSQAIVIPQALHAEYTRSGMEWEDFIEQIMMKLGIGPPGGGSEAEAEEEPEPTLSPEFLDPNSTLMRGLINGSLGVSIEQLASIEELPPMPELPPATPVPVRLFTLKQSTAQSTAGRSSTFMNTVGTTRSSSSAGRPANRIYGTTPRPGSAAKFRHLPDIDNKHPFYHGIMKLHYMNYLKSQAALSANKPAVAGATGAVVGIPKPAPKVAPQQPSVVTAKGSHGQISGILSVGSPQTPKATPSSNVAQVVNGKAISSTASPSAGSKRVENTTSATSNAQTTKTPASPWRQSQSVGSIGGRAQKIPTLLISNNSTWKIISQSAGSRREETTTPTTSNAQTTNRPASPWRQSQSVDSIGGGAQEIPTLLISNNSPWKIGSKNAVARSNSMMWWTTRNRMGFAKPNSPTTAAPKAAPSAITTTPSRSRITVAPQTTTAPNAAPVAITTAPTRSPATAAPQTTAPSQSLPSVTNKPSAVVLNPSQMPTVPKTTAAPKSSPIAASQTTTAPKQSPKIPAVPKTTTVPNRSSKKVVQTPSRKPAVQSGWQSSFRKAVARVQPNPMIWWSNGRRQASINKKVRNPVQIIPSRSSHGVLSIQAPSGIASLRKLWQNKPQKITPKRNPNLWENRRNITPIKASKSSGRSQNVPSSAVSKNTKPENSRPTVRISAGKLVGHGQISIFGDSPQTMTTNAPASNGNAKASDLGTMASSTVSENTKPANSGPTVLISAGKLVGHGQISIFGDPPQTITTSAPASNGHAKAIDLGPRGRISTGKLLGHRLSSILGDKPQAVTTSSPSTNQNVKAAGHSQRGRPSTGTLLGLGQISILRDNTINIATSPSSTSATDRVTPSASGRNAVAADIGSVTVSTSTDASTHAAVVAPVVQTTTSPSSTSTHSASGRNAVAADIGSVTVSTSTDASTHAAVVAPVVQTTTSPSSTSTHSASGRNAVAADIGSVTVSTSTDASTHAAVVAPVVQTTTSPSSTSTPSASGRNAVAVDIGSVTVSTPTNASTNAVVVAPVVQTTTSPSSTSAAERVTSSAADIGSVTMSTPTEASTNPAVLAPVVQTTTSPSSTSAAERVTSSEAAVNIGSVTVSTSTEASTNAAVVVAVVQTAPTAVNSSPSLSNASESPAQTVSVGMNVSQISLPDSLGNTNGNANLSTVDGTQTNAQNATEAPAATPLPMAGQAAALRQADIADLTLQGQKMSAESSASLPVTQLNLGIMVLSLLILYSS